MLACSTKIPLTLNINLTYSGCKRRRFRRHRSGGVGRILCCGGNLGCVWRGNLPGRSGRRRFGRIRRVSDKRREHLRRSRFQRWGGRGEYLAAFWLPRRPAAREHLVNSAAAMPFTIPVFSRGNVRKCRRFSPEKYYKRARCVAYVARGRTRGRSSAITDALFHPYTHALAPAFSRCPPLAYFDLSVPSDSRESGNRVSYCAIASPTAPSRPPLHPGPKCRLLLTPRGAIVHTRKGTSRVLFKPFHTT